MRLNAALVAACLALAGCGGQSEALPENPPATDSGAGAAAPAAAPATAATPEASTFTVDVKLSQAAATKLASANETIVVSAGYYGEPANAPPPTAEGRAAIELGKETVELMQPGKAVFAIANADPAKLHLVENRDAKVLINVFSGRRSSEDNLLDCGMFEDSISVAARQPVRIDCTLIGE